jgi:hypothetical protein
MRSVAKTLSANDTGTTGGHQAGILVPKSSELLSFFPRLSMLEKNPRSQLLVRESISKARWSFTFIYYNNKFFGGTRNEYRLTGMTRYLRSVAAAEGDELMFTKDGDGSIYIELRRSTGIAADISGKLVLTGGWIYIDV